MPVSALPIAVLLCTVTAVPFCRALTLPATAPEAAQSSIGGPPPPAAPLQAESPVRISGGVMAGQMLTAHPPTYPPEARAKHISGTVVLSAHIDKDGNVANLKVISGPEILQQPAMDAVKQWTYRPYVLNGHPVDVSTVITVNFRLQEDTPAAPSTP